MAARWTFPDHDPFRGTAKEYRNKQASMELDTTHRRAQTMTNDFGSLNEEELNEFHAMIDKDSLEQEEYETLLIELQGGELNGEIYTSAGVFRFDGRED
jgi:hypothetical protein